MANDELPSDYDALILGTGMTESILAAALARIGHKVLHLDRNDYYSGDSATFHFEALRKWISFHKGETSEDKIQIDAPDTVLQEEEKLLSLQVYSNTITNVKQESYLKEEPDPIPETLHPVEVKPDGLESSVQCTSTDGQDETNLHQDHQLTSNQNMDDKEKTYNAEKSGDVMEAIDASKGPSDSLDKSAEIDNQIDKIADSCLEKSEVDSEQNILTSIVGDTTNKEIENNETLCEVNDENQQQQITSAVEVSNKPEDNVISEPIKDVPPEWTLHELKQQWRKFNIDLSPKILYSQGAMVELLISSDVAKYCEFRTVTRVLTHMNGNLEPVPCSRSDVFNSKKVSVIEKRMLMKLLTFCMDYETQPNEYKGFEDKPFVEFLKSKKLTVNVRHYVQHAIAMATDFTPTMEGLKNTQMFLRSLGRYGNTAFLWPLYGSGELPQCFCRMCAVFGGIYCLRRTGQSLVVDDNNKCKGIIDTCGKRLNSKFVIMEASYAGPDMLEIDTSRRLSKCILLTDQSMLPDQEDHITLLSIPSPNRQCDPITILELSHVSMACPKNLHVVYLWCKTDKDAASDLQHAVDLLFQPYSQEEDITDANSRPRVLWSVFFNMTDTSDVELSQKCPDNVFIVGGTDSSLDFDRSIAQARRIFDKICPGEDFLPKAPDLEDIIWDDGEGNQPKDSGFSSNQDAPQTDADTDGADADPEDNPEVNADKDGTASCQESDTSPVEIENNQDKSPDKLEDKDR